METAVNRGILTEKEAGEKSILSLAYLGDAVMELYARELLITSFDMTPGALVRLSKEFITCEAQSDAVESILPHLSESELAVFKRGRNAKTHFSPKHARISQYRRATGLEALFGYLHILGETSRERELFALGYADKLDALKNTDDK